MYRVMNMAIELEEDSKDLAEYINVFKRRKKQFAIPFVAILVITIVAVTVWPETYQSSATILIEEQQVPKDLVASTVTSFAAQQIEVIKARIMTMQNIMGLVDRYSLYSEKDMASMAKTEIVSKFTEDIGLDVISAGVMDPRTGRPTEATIAFTLSYKHSVPQKAQKVVSELVNLYLNENLRDRTEKSANTSSFLSDEADRLQEELEQLESALASFKLENEGSLPELYQYNLQVIERTEREALNVTLQIKELEKRKIELESELVQLSPYAPVVMPDGRNVLSNYDRLRALKSEYGQKVAVYSEEHPDVVRIGREIGVLEKEFGIMLSATEHAKQLSAEKKILTELQQRYKANHPKVAAQQRIVDQLIDSQPPEDASDAGGNSPDNPAYVLLDAQLKALVVELQVLKENKAAISEKIKKYEDFILKAPFVEKNYLALQRDYANATEKYQEISAKYRFAELGKSLEQGRKGERFTLIDPPSVPEQPISPNRTAIIFLGIVLAVGAGVVVVAILEALSPAIRGKVLLTKIMGAQPLVIVPYIEIEKEAKSSSGLKIKIVAGVMVLSIIVLSILHNVVMPLDVAWYTFLRKLGI